MSFTFASRVRTRTGETDNYGHIVHRIMASAIPDLVSFPYLQVQACRSE